MGTRGAFGVIINEDEKIGYNQFDSYPSGYGIENLQWLRSVIVDGHLDKVRAAAEAACVVDNTVKPTPEEIAELRAFTNLNVHEQSTDDWYCLTRETHGQIGQMLACGYIEDNGLFPLDSLFCEWAYIVDFDQNVFEVYKGFQKKLPKAGRWKGRPTKEEDEKAYEEHLAFAAEQGRDPWRPLRSEYKAVELVASYPFDALPSDEEFLGYFRLLNARRTFAEGDVEEIAEYVLATEIAADDPYAAEWTTLKEEALLKIGATS